MASSVTFVIIGEKRSSWQSDVLETCIHGLVEKVHKKPWAATEMSSVPHVGSMDRPGEQQCSPSWLWAPQSRIIEKEQTSHCFKGIAEGPLHSPAAYHHPGWCSEVILIVFPCEAIRSRDTLASQCTTPAANITQTSSLYGKSIGSYRCYYTEDPCWVHRKSVLCWGEKDIKYRKGRKSTRLCVVVLCSWVDFEGKIQGTPALLRRSFL